MNDNIMNPEHILWDEFCDKLFGSNGLNFRLEDGKNKWDCDCTPEMSAARKFLSVLNSVDVDGSLDFFLKHDANCDCAILFNVETAYYNEKFSKKLLFPFDSVLKFSTSGTGKDFLLGIFIHRIENSLKIIEIATLINDKTELNENEKITLSKYLMQNENIDPDNFLLILHYPEKEIFELLTFNEDEKFKIISDKNISEDTINHLISLSSV